jgi:hypothetical protein
VTLEQIPASFRDPAGFVYRRDAMLYRQVNTIFRDSFDLFRNSGLYGELTAARLLIPHDEVELSLAATPDAYRVLRPQLIPFISYPYEWCFSQLRDAAALTLDIQLRALRRDLVLRDASAYNVQFLDGQPIFVDSLSFGQYEDGMPWLAYRQFCEHFLAPLAVMSQRGIELGALQHAFSDGIPLPLASKLLGPRSWFNFGLLVNVHLHARAQRRHVNVAPGRTRNLRLAKGNLIRLIEQLQTTVADLSWDPSKTVWADYHAQHSYSQAAAASKVQLVRTFLRTLKPSICWDLGANTGDYSRIAAEYASQVVSLDADPGAVELNYRRIRVDGHRRILPLIVDLLNPSAPSGWGNRERAGLYERGPADTVLALALVHHLTLRGNVPLSSVATMLAAMGKSLIVEFVPAEDPQAQRLVAHRLEGPHPYSREVFERAFQRHFTIIDTQIIENTGRLIYVMTRPS